MIKEAIIKVAKKEDLTYEESKAVMNEIMDGETSQVQTAAYLTALAMKGETLDETQDLPKVCVPMPCS